MPEELWTRVCNIVQQATNKTIPKKKKCKKAKWLPEEALQMAKERREMKTNHSVILEIASKYCILDSFVDYDGYSVSSKGFLPTVVDIMVI